MVMVMSERKSVEWDKTVSFKAEDVLNLALEWVDERKGITHDYLVWAKEFIERKRGEGNISDSEKILFLIAVTSYMKSSVLRSILLHTVEAVIGINDE